MHIEHLQIVTCLVAAFEMLEKYSKRTYELVDTQCKDVVSIGIVKVFKNKVLIKKILSLDFHY